jgi:cadmium resistance protein CadD (predicted permease)
MILIERILYPLINYEIRKYIQTSIVSLIFILAGIYMLMKNKNITVVNDEEREENDDED